LIADLDPREHLSAYLGIFRSSGRFFWIVNYLILLTTLVAVFRKWNIRTSATIVAIALAIQWIDTSPTRNQWVHQDGPVAPIPALKSAVWHSMGKVHRNLIVLPPWQCGWESSPGQRDGFATFGLLAVEQRMRINSFYAARYSARDLQENCSDPPAKLARDGLPRDSVYVVTPRIASLITAGRSGRDACHVIDDFTVCSSATDFGLPPASAPQPALLPSNGALPAWSDPGVAKFLVSGWNGVEPWGSWSKGNALLEFRVTPEQAGASKSIRLKLQLLVGPKDVRYEIQSAGFSVSGSFPGGSIPRIEVFPAQFPISVVKGGVVRITLITAEAVRPIDIGLNGDSRVLGVALMGLALVNP